MQPLVSLVFHNLPSLYPPSFTNESTKVQNPRRNSYAVNSSYGAMHIHNWRAGASQPSRSTGTIFRYIYVYPDPGSRAALHTPTAMFYVVLNIRHRRKMRMRILSPKCACAFSPRTLCPVRFTALWIQFLLATSMDSDCPTPNVQPTLDDWATPSAEACDQRLPLVLLRAQRPATES